MATTDVRYARGGELSIAYQVFSDRPDSVLTRLWMGDLGSMWDQPLLTRYFTRMAEFSRVMIFDKRRIGPARPVRCACSIGELKSVPGEWRLHAVACE